MRIDLKGDNRKFFHEGGMMSGDNQLVMSPINFSSSYFLQAIHIA